VQKNILYFIAELLVCRW